MNIHLNPDRDAAVNFMKCSMNVISFVIIKQCACTGWVCVCACIYGCLPGFMVPAEQLRNFERQRCRQTKSSVCSSRLWPLLFVFITVRHAGAKLAWSHTALWDRRLMYSTRHDNFSTPCLALKCCLSRREERKSPVKDTGFVPPGI